MAARLADRARDYASSPRPASAAPARVEVSVDNDASDSATVIEVRAPDRIGTLYRITKALAELELDVRLAKVTSLGHEVVDAFYVVDRDAARVSSAAVAKALRRRGNPRPTPSLTILTVARSTPAASTRR